MSARAGWFMLLTVACASQPAAGPPPPNPAGGAPLRAVSEFASISDRDEFAVALFEEAGRVLQSPRCLNCHPVARAPTQGDDLHPHVPPMSGGSEGHGPLGLGCNTCHQSDNVLTQGSAIASIPGDPHWAIAPASMAWQGQSLGDICRQMKDPARNGGRSLAQIRHHLAEDHLVGWAWRPGPGRAPAPGTQRDFGELVGAWIEAGAACPP